MNVLDFQVGLPYLTLAAGVLLVMLAVSLKRNHQVAFGGCLVVVLVTIGTHFYGWSYLPSSGVNILDQFLIDGFSYFFNILFLLGTLVTVLLIQPYLEQSSENREEFYLLLLTATLGAMTMASAMHFVPFVLGLEILSISLYAMIAYPERTRPPLEASLKYLILSGVASSFILFGMALIYAAYGTMEFWTETPNTGFHHTYAIIGHTLMWGGLAFKLSLVPFHMWTPDVYQGAPTVVTGYLATVSKGAVAALVLRYAIETGFLQTQGLFMVISIIALLSMIGGNVLALLQKNIKRLLAYSSIAHLGYLLIGILLASVADAEFAVETVMVYLTAYFLITLAAFGVVNVVSVAHEDERVALDSYTGLFWSQPLLAAILTLASLSLAGIPLTIGFIAKFYLFAAGIEGTMWLLIWGLIIGSAIGVFYYLRIIISMARKPESADGPTFQIPFGGLLTVCALGLSLLFFGVYPAPLLELIQIVVSMSSSI